MTSAPCAAATSAISASSVETTTSSPCDGEGLLDRPRDQRLAAAVGEVLAGDALRAAAGGDDAEGRVTSASRTRAMASGGLLVGAGGSRRRGRRRRGACRNGPRTPAASGRVGEVDPRRQAARGRLEHAGREDATRRAPPGRRRGTAPSSTRTPLATPACVQQRATRGPARSGAVGTSRRGRDRRPAAARARLAPDELGGVQLAEVDRPVRGRPRRRPVDPGEQLRADHRGPHVGAARCAQNAASASVQASRWASGGSGGREGSEQAVLGDEVRAPRWRSACAWTAAPIGCSAPPPARAGTGVPAASPSRRQRHPSRGQVDGQHVRRGRARRRGPGRGAAAPP